MASEGGDRCLSPQTFDLDDMMANDDIEEEDEENVPPPPPQIPTVRPTKRVVNVNHTRECSRRPCAKASSRRRTPGSRSTAGTSTRTRCCSGKNLVGKDGRTIEEADPTWLKSQSGQVLRVRRHHECGLGVRRCSGTRCGPRRRVQSEPGSMLPETEQVRGVRTGLRPRAEALRCFRCLEGQIRMRRAAARCGAGKYSEAAEDFRQAASLADRDSDDQKRLFADAVRADVLAEAARCKLQGDALLKSGDAKAAVDAYGEALSHEPSFVSALANGPRRPPSVGRRGGGRRRLWGGARYLRVG